MRILAKSCRLESRAQALLAGVDAFVSKSEPPERLIQAVRKMVSTSLPTTRENAKLVGSG